MNPTRGRHDARCYSTIDAQRSRPNIQAVGQVLAIAEQILAGELGLVEGARKLSRFSGSLPDDPAGSQLMLFVTIDSETEDLPLGESRSLWSPTWLAESERRVDEYVAAVREEALRECTALIERYGAKH